MAIPRDNIDVSNGQWDLDDFEVGKTLGTGRFGRVKVINSKATNKSYALKVLRKAAAIKMKCVDHIINERRMLITLKHPFVVNMFGSFQDPRYIYFLLEYIVGGTLPAHLGRAGRFENDQSKFYASQIVAFFEYCHPMNIAYRSLVPENILINMDGYLKLTDFGLAKVVEFRTYTLCIAPEYLAPEVLLNKGHGKPVDWWQLGCLIYEMIVGCLPFVDEDPMAIYNKILSGKIVFPRLFDKHAKSLVKKFLVASPARRYGTLERGADDVKQHKWFKDLSWDQLLEKQIPAPFRPVVQGENDTSNFDEYPDSEGQPQMIDATQDPFAFLMN